MASTYKLSSIQNMTMKLLDEYCSTASVMNSGVLDRLTDLINHYYFELSEKDKTSAVQSISHFPVANMLGETFDYDTWDGTTAVTYSQASAYAYYFWANGAFTVEIKEGSSTSTLTTLATVSGSAGSVSAFTRYRGFMTGTVSADYYQLSFTGDAGKPYQVKNVAFYPYTFGNATASIPDFLPESEYTLSSDFMRVNKATYRYGSDWGAFSDYRILSDKLLVPRGYSAEFAFHYFTQATPLTSSSDAFNLKDKSCLMIPYAVAADILIGNGLNIGAGQYLMAQYERMKAQIDTSEPRGRQTITNMRSW